MIRGERLALTECIASMQRVAAHPAQHTVLAIVMGACDDDLAAIAAEEARIVAAWQRAGP